MSSGRHGRGYRKTLIPCVEVQRIREHAAAGTYTQSELARMWSTSPSNISSIVSGRSRKDCPGPRKQAKVSLGEFLAGE